MRLRLFKATAAAAFLANLASGTPVFNFSLGPTTTYSSGVWGYTNSGEEIIASGFLVTGNSATDLYTKGPANGADESGLGTVIDTPDHEVTDDQFLQLNVSGLINDGYTSLSLYIGSLQSGESAVISYGNHTGNLALNGPAIATLTGGPVTQSYIVALTAGKNYIDLTGFGPNSGPEDSGDFILESATATGLHRVPDASSTVELMAFVFVGLAALRRKISRA